MLSWALQEESDPARSDESDPARSESTAAVPCLVLPLSLRLNCGGAAAGVAGAAPAEPEADCGGAAAEVDGFIHGCSVCKKVPSGKTALEVVSPFSPSASIPCTVNPS
eukprot:2993056-Amphidinium_carterae.1